MPKLKIQIALLILKIEMTSLLILKLFFRKMSGIL